MTDEEKRLVLDVLDNEFPYIYLGAGFSYASLKDALRDILPVGRRKKRLQGAF